MSYLRQLDRNITTEDFREAPRNSNDYIAPKQQICEKGCTLDSFLSIFTLPSVSTEDNKEAARREYLERKLALARERNPVAGVDPQRGPPQRGDVRKAKLEDDFNSWLANKPESRGATTGSGPDLGLFGSSPASGPPPGPGPSAGMAGGNLSLLQEEEARRHRERMQLEKQEEILNNRERAVEEARRKLEEDQMKRRMEIQARTSQIEDEIDETRKRVEQELAFQKEKQREYEAAKKAREAKQFADFASDPIGVMGFMSMAGSVVGGLTGAGAEETPSYAKEESLENFEKLLGTDGLTVSVYLPTKDNKAKRKTALFKCVRDSTTFSCRIRSSGQEKKLKFDAHEILLVNKGKGSSIPLPGDADVSCMLFFSIKDKPELNLQFETPLMRDAAVEGFNYIIKRRLGGAGVIRNAKFVNEAKSSSGGLKILYIGWCEIKVGGILVTKFAPRLLLLTSDRKLTLFVPPNNSRDNQPDDFKREFRKYFSGRWNHEILLSKNYTIEKYLLMNEISSVTPNAKDKMVVELWSDTPTPFKFTEEHLKHDFFEFFDLYVKKLKRGT